MGPGRPAPGHLDRALRPARAGRSPAPGLRRPVSGRWRPQAASVAIQPACGRPRVLISYSTESVQNSPQRVQTALDALASLPLDVLATTSGAFNGARLRVPGNATVLDYLPHDCIMATVELMVCHGGHGTTMAALCCGVPLVCIPGLGRDQAPDRRASQRTRPRDRTRRRRDNGHHPRRRHGHFGRPSLPLPRSGICASNRSP